MNSLTQLWQAGYNAGFRSDAYPGVIERGPQAERIIEVDVRAKLIQERIILLSDPIYPQVANIIVSQMLFLQSQNDKAEIQLFINSPGGSVLAGLAIYDAMQFVRCPVSTICIGLAASMGALLLCAGRKDRRFCLPNARIMIHQPWTEGIGGTVSDVMIEAKELQKTKDRLNGIIARHSGKDIGEVEKATDRNNWLSPEEAKAFGLIDDLTGVPPG